MKCRNSRALSLGRGLISPHLFLALSLGRGWPAAGAFISRGGPGEGFVHSQHPRNLISHLAHEPLWVVQHQSIRNPQQSYADGSEVIFLLPVPPHLAWLRVYSTIKLDGQPLLEAIEIDHPLVDARLAAELCAQPPVAQQAPRGPLGFGLVMP